MSCRSWWCADVTVELGRAPRALPVTLPCGCTATRTGEEPDSGLVTFTSVACTAHQSARPDRIPPDTPVRIDVLTTLLTADA